MQSPGTEIQQDRGVIECFGIPPVVSTSRFSRRAIQLYRNRLRYRSLSGALMRSFMRISVPTVRHTEGAVLYVVSPQVVASGQSAMEA